MVSSAAALSCCASCGAIYKEDYPRCPADGGEIVRTDKDPLIGTTIDGYVIDGLLGEGGMGRVYTSHRADRPGTRYAFKVMLGDLAASVKSRKRFVQEAEKLAHVNSPHVVRLIAHGTTSGGLPYLVLEHLDGRNVRELLLEAPMDSARVIALARQMAEGLRAAHAAGIVHRDLKPDNVLVTTEAGREVAHLIDFGLAVAEDAEDARLTSTGMFMATPAYAAPEQVTRNDADHRVDLYALGASMFEMLTGGMLPFEGTDMECVTAKIHREAPRLSERVPHLRVPDGLQDVVALLLRRNAAERPRDATAVIAALDALVTPEAPLFLPRPASGRSPWLLPVLAFVAASAIFITTVVLIRRAARHPVAAAPPADATVSDAAVAEVVHDAPTVAVADPPEPRADAAIEEVASPAPIAPPRPHRHRTPRGGRHSQVATAHAVTTPVVVPELPPAPPPVAPPVLRASLASLDVSGALSVAEVRRAVTRLMPSFDRCAPTAPATVTARFSIGEHRRAERVSTHGAPDSTDTCVTRALGSLRTESAPDVGDVSVTAQVQFSAVP